MYNPGHPNMIFDCYRRLVVNFINKFSNQLLYIIATKVYTKPCQGCFFFPAVDDDEEENDNRVQRLCDDIDEEEDA